MDIRYKKGMVKIMIFTVGDIVSIILIGLMLGIFVIYLLYVFIKDLIDKKLRRDK